MFTDEILECELYYMIDHRSCTQGKQFSVKLGLKKNLAGKEFKPMTSAIPVQCSTN